MNNTRHLVGKFDEGRVVKHNIGANNHFKKTSLEIWHSILKFEDEFDLDPRKETLKN